MLFSCASRKAGEQINGDCILLEFANERASCGIHSVWIGMKLKEVNSSLTFIGLVNCPDFYSVPDPIFFKTGKIYKIIAKRPLNTREGDVIINEYDSTGLIVFRIDELKKK